MVVAPIVSACGPVQTDESGEYWVGATRTAEMQAMIEALYWLHSCIEGKLYSPSTKELITVDLVYVKGAHRREVRGKRKQGYCDASLPFVESGEEEGEVGHTLGTRTHLRRGEYDC